MTDLLAPIRIGNDRQFDGCAEASVIICAYTLERWMELCEAVKSCITQEPTPLEVIVVIDHNPELFNRARQRFLPWSNTIIVIENQFERGLSGARNTGIDSSTAAVVAFLDDDAEAAPGWIANLLLAFEDSSVMVAGGAISPAWQTTSPRWFPEEFNWVLGCSYTGLPTVKAPVRNPIGANMAFRREVFEQVGGFRAGLGRVGKHPLGCEETELCIRTRQLWPDSINMYEPAAVVRHNVPDTRGRLAYFRSRCYAEGLSKARMTGLVGSNDGLSAERTYVTRVLPTAVLRGMYDAAKGDLTGLGRSGAVVVGLGSTMTGYLAGKVWDRRPGNAAPAPASQAAHQTAAAVRGFEPTFMVEVEMSQDIQDVFAPQNAEHRFERICALVRIHTQPLGQIELELKDGWLSAAELTEAIHAEFGDEIELHYAFDAASAHSDHPDCLFGTPTPDNAPMVSIVVPTKDRPEELARCLDSLTAIDYPRFEIIVVDNAPSDEETRKIVDSFADDSRVRYVRENIAGSSRARNRGTAEAKGSIVAFTDDDVLADPQWLNAVVRRFNLNPEAVCVTGLVLPANLTSEAQAWFEQYGGFAKGYQPKIFDLVKNRHDSPLYPYTAGMFGSGNNVAFRKDAIEELGGYDVAMGPGTSAPSGEDLALFLATVLSGNTIAYEPRAIVRHRHRPDYEGLAHQLHSYGKGITSILTKCIMDDPRHIVMIARRAPEGLRLLLRSGSSKNARRTAGFPRRLATAELLGIAAGPFAYVKSRKEARSI